VLCLQRAISPCKASDEGAFESAQCTASQAHCPDATETGGGSGKELSDRSNGGEAGGVAGVPLQGLPNASGSGIGRWKVRGGGRRKRAVAMESLPQASGVGEGDGGLHSGADDSVNTGEGPAAENGSAGDLIRALLGESEGGLEVVEVPGLQGALRTGWGDCSTGSLHGALAEEEVAAQAPSTEELGELLTCPITQVGQSLATMLHSSQQFCIYLDLQALVAIDVVQGSRP